MREEHVIHEQREGYSVVILNRPAVLNAFNKAQHVALRQVLDACRTSKDCRAVLLTGAGRGFCAGQDLTEQDRDRLDQRPDLGRVLEDDYNPLIRTLRDMDKPVICAVNGVAAGAGANIALACDLVLAARSARFVQAFARIGLVPDCGGTWFLTRLLGEARAKALALTGSGLSAEEAAAWGLIWRAVDDDKLMIEATALAEGLAKGPTCTYGLIKQAIHAAAGNGLDRQLDLERDLQREAGRGDDYREGVAAFLEKRAPVFGGRTRSDR